ncbi:hypothetical protein LUW74_10440 [Actinomadura madurae]|uniref:hypothetical protein n=1 Tax=Actinomadura madurae TaxID=1993 RepID=UPI002026D1A5|nr:hypothetical protein [Actinomadura madurae]URN03707.1 hypothetical protein LUW74_10440 [Actinomadura madurae]
MDAVAELADPLGERVARPAVDAERDALLDARRAEDVVAGEVAGAVERAGVGGARVRVGREQGRGRGDHGRRPRRAEPAGHDEGAEAAHGPADEADAAGPRAGVVQARQELVHDHGDGVVAGRAGVPVGVGSAVHGGEGERRDAVGGGVRQVVVQCQLTDERSPRLGAAVQRDGDRQPAQGAARGGRDDGRGDGGPAVRGVPRHRPDVRGRGGRGGQVAASAEGAVQPDLSGEDLALDEAVPGAARGGDGAEAAQPAEQERASADQSGSFLLGVRELDAAAGSRFPPAARRVRRRPPGPGRRAPTATAAPPRR